MASGWILLVIAVLAALLGMELVRRILKSRVGGKLALTGPLLRRCTLPGFATAAVVAINLVFTPNMVSDRRLGEAIQRIITVAVIACVTWLLIQASYAVTDVVLERLLLIEGARNRRARRIRTQITLVRRFAAAAVIVIAIGAMLFSFPAVQALGAGLLASAGIVGVVAGIAAQSTLGNIFAGLQLAFSDALRLDDVIVVGGEWGRIEELSLTYVSLRLWDERRLILPVSYFTTHPFENWTREESRVLGSVHLRVDWSVPVDELRTELYHVLKEHPLWDQRDWVLQVTDITDGGLVELRALMSASDAPSAWDLRCDIREHLVSYIRVNHPQALPRLRVTTTDEEEASARLRRVP
jgi:small-conductance mechanosensitive channel